MCTGCSNTTGFKTSFMETWFAEEFLLKEYWLRIRPVNSTSGSDYTNAAVIVWENPIIQFQLDYLSVNLFINMSIHESIYKSAFKSFISQSYILILYYIKSYIYTVYIYINLDRNLSISPSRILQINLSISIYLSLNKSFYIQLSIYKFIYQLINSISLSMRSLHVVKAPRPFYVIRIV